MLTRAHSARSLLRPRTLLIVGLAMLLALAGGAAWAYFLNGSGRGSATTDVVSKLTLISSAPTKALYPGSSVAVAVIVANSNRAPLQFNTVSVDTAQGTNGYNIDSSHLTAGCTVASAALSFSTQSSGWSIPAFAAGIPLSLPSSALAMGLSAPNACQGATVTVYLKAS